jgi:hypothetical protein
MIRWMWRMSWWAENALAWRVNPVAATTCAARTDRFAVAVAADAPAVLPDAGSNP